MSRLKTYLSICSLVLICGNVAVAEERREVPAPPITTKVIVDQSKLEKSIRDGVDFLLKHQNKDGSWGNATKTKGINIYAPLPGAHHAYRAGSTMLALQGLIASKDQRPQVHTAIKRCEVWMFEHLSKLRRAELTTTYNVWGHAYCLRALAMLAQCDGVNSKQLETYKQFAQQQVELLERYQYHDGGWGYYNLGKTLKTQKPAGDSMSFTTATVMHGLIDARDILGCTLKKDTLQLAVKTLHRQELPGLNFAYAHSHRRVPAHPINRTAGSLARTQVCITALKRAGDERITQHVQEKIMDSFVKRNGWLDIARKRPKPHDIHFGISGYFYYYGHYYAGNNIALLPEEARSAWRHKIAHILMSRQDRDGSWWDFPLYNYHQSYGTGFVLVTLSKCRDK